MFIVKVGPCYLKAPVMSIPKEQNPLVDTRKEAYKFPTKKEANGDACFLQMVVPAGMKVEIVKE